MTTFVDAIQLTLLDASVSIGGIRGIELSREGGSQVLRSMRLQLLFREKFNILNRKTHLVTTSEPFNLLVLFYFIEEYEIEL